MSAEAGDPGGWQSLRELLAQALEASADERRLLLQRLDATAPEKASELRELLLADGVESSALDRGVFDLVAGRAPLLAGFAPSDADLRSVPGTRLGVWRLGEKLGQGGMGTVYAAERADGTFAQSVAIKILRRGIDTPELERRFLRERQLLAHLDHPAIVKVLDGGVTAEGLPWFALERVDGVPINRYAVERGLPVAARVRLMVEVCEAVDAAHRRLIVHRDLKPSNLLVTADGRVKLLDFGIAKVLEAEEDEALTRTGARLLTPQYAAPEQILGEPVTTAVDVYALGVVLYELLTGAVPHRRSTASPAGLARELESETTRPPSSRVLETGPGARELARELAGDLDAIVLKALRPEPEERYTSVAALATDLGRHLADRPVEARAGDRRYRTGRFLRRHRGAVVASAALGLAILAGGLATLYEASRARAERDQARIQAQTARRVSEFMAHLFQQADPARTRGAQLTAREVLEAGARKVDLELAGEPEVQASLRLAIGAVERDLGLYEEARPLLEGALAERRSLFGAGDLATAEALYELGLLDRFLNRRADGLQNLTTALEIRQRLLGPDHPEVARAHSALGVALRFGDDSRAARPHFERALAIATSNAGAGGVSPDEIGRWQNSYGLILADLGEYAGAEVAYRKAIATLEAGAGAQNPLLALPLDNLGMLLRTEERLAEAEPVLRRAVALVQRSWGEKHTQYATALNSLGTLLRDRNRCDEAVALLRRAAAIYAAALGPEHPYIAYPLLNEGECELAAGRAGNALTAFRRVLEIRERADPTGSDSTIAQGRNRVGAALLALGRLDEAESELRAAVAMARATLEPQAPMLGEEELDLAACLALRGRTDEARSLAAEALQLLLHNYPEGHSEVVRARQQLARLGA